MFPTQILKPVENSIQTCSISVFGWLKKAVGCNCV